jgi:hypothetical protein
VELYRRDQLHCVGEHERRCERLERRPGATFTITPETTGTYVYSLTCSNTAGTSPTASVTLTVTAATDTGGGGGKVDPASLLVLAGCVVFLRRRLMRGAPGWAPAAARRG